MNDEIKEILDYYKKDAEKFEYLMKDYTEEQLKTTFSRSYQRYKNHKLLLDYITNLQQAIKDTKDTADDMLFELKQENERLKEQLKKDNHILGCNFASKDKYKQRYEDYKSRCEKAISKIKDLYSYSDNEEYVDNYCKELLNILQNGSDDND